MTSINKFFMDKIEKNERVTMKILMKWRSRRFELLAIYLKIESYEIVKTPDGKQTLEKLKMYPDIDMIILDIWCHV